ncbi:MAG: energy transducer TonB [Bacteroidia bacterium]|nr:energy transducer TonB [Bacteroidia bacterium]
MNKLIIILSLMIIAFSQCKSQTLELVVDRGSVVDNFIGGNTEFYNVFRSKIRFPAELKSEKIIGNVYFEIEIDTTGNIIDFKILKGVSPLMDKEVENKIYLTNGKWIPMIKNGNKTNYKLIEKVYFELR